MRLLISTALLTALVLSGSRVDAQQCVPQVSDPANQRARREAAVQYLESVYEAQSASQRTDGTYRALDAVAAGPIPVGFVPRLVFDRWGYVMTLRDYFDRCGFAFFANELGEIYEARPRSTRFSPVEAGGPPPVDEPAIDGDSHESEQT